MLQVSSLSKSYGPRVLFDEVTFSLTSGERLGLVGRNGCGKSTLFKLILDQDQPDEGTVSFPKGYRVGHLAQHLQFSKPTLVEEACLGLPEEDRDQTYRAEIILSGLGFLESDYLRAPSEFSGGFQIRLNLAKLLLSEPNLLLLDEPTNYLDILSMRWLTTFLKDWPDEVILITHDRQFMDDVCTHTMLIHRGAVKKIRGNTAKLYEQVATDEEIYEKTRVNEDKKRKELEQFINRFRAQASKASLVQSKVKALERMGQKDELAEIATLEFDFRCAPQPSKISLTASDLTFGYEGGPPLIQDLSLTIGRNERIGIIGKNGKGKSTLLKLLAAEMPPNGGSISVSPNTRSGYFGQTNISRLSEKSTVEDEVWSVNPALSKTAVRSICGTMMFSGDDALKKIGMLSGGEKSRVLLGKLLAQPSNLLLLDEPTNHLDMESIEALIESLKGYDGAVVIVTHSERILRSLATKLVVFQGDAPVVLDHDYDFFLEKYGWEEEGGTAPTKQSKPTAIEEKKASPSDTPSPTPKALQKKIAVCEEEISKLEVRQRELEQSVAEAYGSGARDNGDKLSKELQGVKDQIELAFGRLQELDAQLKA